MTTHKHWDHAAHNQWFVDTYPGIRVISGTNEPVFASNENIADGDTLTNLLDGSITVEAFETPCHTRAHNMFIVTIVGAQDINKMIFTGDCLFEGGVGMFFEGNPEQMYTIMDNLFNRRITENHERCALFFGHDYGWKNYMWAHDFVFNGETTFNKFVQDGSNQSWFDLRLRVERRNADLMEKREQGFANTGTLLSEEMETNLFMIAFLEAH